MIRNLTIGEITLSHLEDGYNHAGRNERTIEVPLGQAFVRLHKNVVEVGAVLPYYQTCKHEIVDETDNKATVFADAVEYGGLKGKSVLSISTVEHMGTGKYGGKVDQYMPKYFLQKLIDEAKDYLVTAPIGYTAYADNLIKVWDDLGKITVIYLVRDKNNQWSVTDQATAMACKYDKPYKWANAIAVITNWTKLLAAPATKERVIEGGSQELDVSSMSVKEVLTEVEEKRLTVEAAIEAERNGKARKSLIKKLEAMQEVEAEEKEPAIYDTQVVGLDPVSAEDVATWETQDDPGPPTKKVDEDYIDIPEDDKIPW